MYKSINYLEGSMRVINIVPVELRGKIWYCVAFEPADSSMGDAMHLAFVYKNDFKSSDDLLANLSSIDLGESPAVRIHSECLLGDAMGSSLCDCGEQLEYAMSSIVERGCGVMIYLRQEGRGIGMRAKLACLAVQEGYVAGVRISSKLSSDEANVYCGFPIDNRDYLIVPEILSFLNVDRLTMYTGNPEKIQVIRDAGITIDQVDDVSKELVEVGSRKHRELTEKIKRNYQYEGVSI